MVVYKLALPVIIIGLLKKRLDMKDKIKLGKKKKIAKEAVQSHEVKKYKK
jgi:hypothetical protein